MRYVPFAAAALSLVIAAPAAAALPVGAAAPGFSTSGAEGGKLVDVDLEALLSKGPVVLFFFPSAFTETEGCREFASNSERFRAAGVSVVGMSRDSAETLARFSTQECLATFPLASANESIVNGFDVNDGAMFNTRTTYVIAPSHKIAFVYDDAEPGNHAKNALAFVQGMKK